MDFESSEIYHFKGYHGCPSKCGLNIYEREDRAIVLLTERPDNPGTSVTNSIEELATRIYNERFPGCPVENIRFIEHYPADVIHPEPTFDLVEMDWSGNAFRNPRWKRISKDVLRLDAEVA